MSRRAHLLRYRPRAFHLDPTHGLSRGLVAAYLGGGSGETRYWDSGPQRLHGTLTGFTGAGNTPVDRWSRANGRAVLSFNGTGDYVALPGNVLACGATDSMTVYARARYTNTGSRGVIAAKYSAAATGCEWLLWFNGNNAALRWDVYTTSGGAQNTASWPSSACVDTDSVFAWVDAGAAQVGIAVNAASPVTQPLTVTRTAGTYPATIGASPALAWWLGGSVSDSCGWSRVLSAAERAVLASPDPLYDGWVIPDVARRYFVPGASGAKPWLWCRPRGQLIGGGLL